MTQENTFLDDCLITDAKSKLIAADDTPQKYMQLSNWDNSEVRIEIRGQDNNTIWRKKLKLASFHSPEAYLDKVGSITRNAKLMAAAPSIIEGLLEIIEKQRQEIERLEKGD